MISLIIICILVSALLLAGVSSFFIKAALLRNDRVKMNTVNNKLNEEIADNLQNYGPGNERKKEKRKKVEEWKNKVCAEKVAVNTDDGTQLIGTVYYSDNVSESTDILAFRDKWVILLHGYKGRKEEMDPFAMEYWKQGFNCLCVDCRAHGESRGKYIGMGYLDGKDLQHWIALLRDSYGASRIVLHGHSMGGATVVTAAGIACKGNEEQNIKAVIADCPFSEARAIFAKQMEDWFRIPAFPLIDIINAFFILKGGYSFRKASAVRYASVSKIPVLFIHGSDDSFVPPEMSEILCSAVSAPKKRIVIEGAGHIKAQNVNPGKYYAETFAFISRYMNEL